MFLPCLAHLYNRNAPDKPFAIDERKMNMAVLKVAELRFLSLPRSWVNRATIKRRKGSTACRYLLAAITWLDHAAWNLPSL
jgi:hypothetical protein